MIASGGEVTPNLFDLGWAGILAAAICYVFRVYVNSVDERIKSLEKRAEACEKDRSRLHDEISDQNRMLIEKTEEIVGCYDRIEGLARTVRESNRATVQPQS